MKWLLVKCTRLKKGNVLINTVNNIITMSNAVLSLTLTYKMVSRAWQLLIRVDLLFLPLFLTRMSEIDISKWASKKYITFNRAKAVQHWMIGWIQASA